MGSSNLTQTEITKNPKLILDVLSFYTDDNNKGTTEKAICEFIDEDVKELPDEPSNDTLDTSPIKEPKKSKKSDLDALTKIQNFVSPGDPTLQYKKIKRIGQGASGKVSPPLVPSLIIFL